MADDGNDGHRQSRLVTDEDGTFDAEGAREESLPIENGEVIDTDALSDHQTYLEGRGIYDERNRLNDLTGREWKFATKSVIPQAYPPDLQHDLRSEHGGQKPPRLCAELIGRFSKAGETVLDPFAGVGGTLLGASCCEHEGTGRRDAIGFERTARWIEVYETVLKRENERRREAGEPPLASQEMRHGDCRDLAAELETDSVDLLLTDVPYWDMDEREQTRNERATRASKLGTFDDERAASNAASESEGVPVDTATESAGQSKAHWLEEMADAFDRFTRPLKPGRYAVVFIGDMYQNQSYEFLSADLARTIEAETSLTLVANLIWYDPSKDLHVYGYPFSFVPSMVHQNVLVFRLEE
ncbi:site-specific DNA-methyltransferase [Halobacteria archaeon AArc-curdl1]|uniref:Type II methyltransferase n=1 Tax=Natronosalvus hydrolyticus TaxID=2979988 RepID=A0AAP3E5H8_9EURY|nr:site-specific DNA-methyltransferase [Halobacteria archaeon AArc-curdl1]